MLSRKVAITASLVVTSFLTVQVEASPPYATFFEVHQEVNGSPCNGEFTSGQTLKTKIFMSVANFSGEQIELRVSYNWVRDDTEVTVRSHSISWGNVQDEDYAVGWDSDEYVSSMTGTHGYHCTVTVEYRGSGGLWSAVDSEQDSGVALVGDAFFDRQ